MAKQILMKRNDVSLEAAPHSQFKFPTVCNAKIMDAQVYTSTHLKANIYLTSRKIIVS